MLRKPIGSAVPDPDDTAFGRYLKPLRVSVNENDWSRAVQLAVVLIDHSRPRSLSANTLRKWAEIRTTKLQNEASALGIELPRYPPRLPPGGFNDVGALNELLAQVEAYEQSQAEAAEWEAAEMHSRELLNSLRAATVVLRAALGGEDGRALPALVAGTGAELEAAFDQEGGEALGPPVPGEQVGTALQHEGDHALAPLVEETPGGLQRADFVGPDVGFGSPRLEEIMTAAAEVEALAGAVAQRVRELSAGEERMTSELRRMASSLWDARADEARVEARRGEGKRQKAEQSQK
jgi:hypothetical protein